MQQTWLNDDERKHKDNTEVRSFFVLVMQLLITLQKIQTIEQTGMGY